jgi:hypothetical protein
MPVGNAVIDLRVNVTAAERAIKRAVRTVVRRAKASRQVIKLTGARTMATYEILAVCEVSSQKWPEGTVTEFIVRPISKGKKK